VTDRGGAEKNDPRPWWYGAVIYQVYVRSFADGDGDGLGDLAGIIARLDHIADLGVDAIWLNPCYPSPQADGGYDVSDYRDVDARFGTLERMDELIATAHQRGLRVILDLVPNHTSDEHEWFRAALATRPGSTQRARYLFRDGSGPDGAGPPNNWRSVFGGPAWERIVEADGTPGQWYLHLFDTKQPDLDWTNPEVQEEFLDILRFWFDRDVDGFRIDVAHGLAKDPDLSDVTEVLDDSGRSPTGLGENSPHPHWDRDEVHDVYRDWRALSDTYPGDRVFVAELWVETPERLARYLRPGELHTAFNFELLEASWSADSLRTAIDSSMTALGDVGAPATWVLSNHDVVRHVTRYGDGDVGRSRARAAILLLLALPGSAYIYQGDELGLSEVLDLPDHLRQDPTFVRSGGVNKGRDGCRVPLPWSGDAPPFGFGPAGTPWLPQPPEWAELTIARQRAEPTSMLRLYRTALATRRSTDALRDGTFTWLDVGPDSLAFMRRPGFACVVNTSGRPLALPSDLNATLLLASDAEATANVLPGNAAIWLTLAS
jgi:alpha-glucosidase